MKDNQRGVRRAHNNRVKCRAFRIYRNSWFASNYDTETLKQRAAKRANNLKNCSCFMCGNPRRYYSGTGRFTIGELRQQNNLKDGLSEYFEGNNT